MQPVTDYHLHVKYVKQLLCFGECDVWLRKVSSPKRSLTPRSCMLEPVAKFNLYKMSNRLRCYTHQVAISVYFLVSGVIACWFADIWNLYYMEQFDFQDPQTVCNILIAMECLHLWWNLCKTDLHCWMFAYLCRSLEWYCY